MLAVMLSIVCWIYFAFFAQVFGAADQLKGQVTFTLTDPISFVPNYPLRSVAQGWTGLTNLPACAYKSFNASRSSIGFLYSSSQRLCTPLTGFVVPGTDGARQLEESEGQLYLFKRDCPPGFQLYQIDGSTTCLRVSNDLVNYTEATSRCESWGGRLVATKTTTKVELVRALSADSAGMSISIVYIGLDDLEKEDTFIWQIDGTEMTDEQRSFTFHMTEPNDNTVEFDEDCVCVYVQNTIGYYVDVSCLTLARFICEATHQ